MKKMGRSPRALGLGLAVTIGLMAGYPNSAWAGPREDMREAYATALDQFNNLDYPAARSAIDSGIDQAEAAGAGNDPSLASLYVLRAALFYSEEGDAAMARIDQALQQAVRLNYYVVIPIEVRSDELMGFLKKARSSSGGAAPDAITHAFPEPACGGDLIFEALLGVPDGGQAALYWRKVGDPEYQAVPMDAFSNVATATVGASAHQDADVEYIIAAFNAQNENVANLGTQEAPLKLAQGCGAAGDGDVAGDGDAGDGDLGDGDQGDGGDGGDDGGAGGAIDTPKVWVNLGVGTGFGIARGTVEQTYAQMRPAPIDYVYGDAQGACAVARFVSGAGNDLLDTQQLYGIDPFNPDASSAFGVFAPAGKAAAYAQAYDEAACAERHPVTNGLAPALFHIEPEVAFRLGDRVVLGVFSRLQVATGSNVQAPDPDKPLGQPAVMQAGTTYWDSARSEDPASIKIKHAFTWAVGLKFKYLLGKDGAKFRPYVGGFAGYGSSRLRVNLGFGQDRNGNSVPDDEEVGADALNNDASLCEPVWPYNNSCNDPQGQGDNLIPVNLSANSSGQRIDTVVIGPGFLGALVGFNLQFAKHFGLYGEFQAGGWFPNTGSALFDINIGPQVTF